MSKVLDITGQRFGSLTVERYCGSCRRNGVWFCRCDCENTRQVTTAELNNGRVLACSPCMLASRQKKAIEASVTHGHSIGGCSKTYRAWTSMRSRCLNPNNRSYASYGGRGISVCDRWMNSFEAFLEDMGEAPDGLSLDRIDVYGDYYPGNCRWADAITQAVNRRTTRLIEYGGEVKPVSYWAKDLGVSPQAMQYRIEKYGVEGALRNPIGTSGRGNLVEFNGERKTVTAWARELGVERRSLSRQIQRWGADKALANASAGCA